MLQRPALASRLRPALACPQRQASRQPRPQPLPPHRLPPFWRGPPREYRQRSAVLHQQTLQPPAWRRASPSAWLQPRRATTPPPLRLPVVPRLPAVPGPTARRHRYRFWPARPRESLPPTLSSSQPSNSLGKSLCQMRRIGSLEGAQIACSRHPHSHKKLVSAAIGRVRDFFHELPLKLYL